MKKITLALSLFFANCVTAQFLVKPTFFETLAVSNTGVVSGYVDQAGPYSLWNPEEQTFYEIGGAAPGLGVGGACKFSADGAYLSGTNYIDLAISTDWIKENLAGYNYIFQAIEFPENQNLWGYAVGQSLTFNGNGIVLRTANGGTNWAPMWVDSDQNGLEAMSFPTQFTGYVGGWNAYFAKTTSGGNDWTVLNPGGSDPVYKYTTIDFRDDLTGVVTAQLDEDVSVYVTSDGGDTWTTGTGLAGIATQACYAGDDTFFLVTMDGQIQRSTDNGMTWTTVHSTGNLLAGISFADTMTGIATGSGFIYKTTDGGENWTALSVTPGLTFRDVKWLDAQNLVLAGSSDAIFTSTDGGSTWTWDNLDVANGEPSLYAVAVTAQNIHVCGSGGTFYKKSRISSTVVAEMSRYEFATGEWTALGSLGQNVDNNTSAGYFISADGNTVVGNAWANPANGNGTTNYAHAFAWTQGVGAIDLGSLFSNMNRSSRANAVSADGNVVVGLQDLNGPWKSAVWRKNDQGGYDANEYLLVDPSGSASDEFNQLGECSYVTPDGTWIGGEGDFANGNQPWIWSENTGVINLGDLSDGMGWGRVGAISPDGSYAIGWFNQMGWGTMPIPFIWTAQNGIQEFNDFVNNTLNIDTGDYYIYIPNNMSLNGRFITGWGVNPTIGPWGELFTFRLELPENLGVASPVASTTSVYPNPVTDVLNIPQEVESVEIYSISGQLISTQKPDSTGQIDMSSLSQGIYLIKTIAAQQSFFHKIVKQ